jgi:hypothetical protein
MDGPPLAEGHRLMSAARAPQLHVLPSVDDEQVKVSRVALERAIADVDALADDLEAGIRAATHRIFAGSRPAALNELHRLGLRVQQLRDDFEPLGGKPRPRPIRLA